MPILDNTVVQEYDEICEATRKDAARDSVTKNKELSQQKI